MCAMAYMVTTQYVFSAGPEISLNISVAYFKFIPFILLSNLTSIFNILLNVRHYFSWLVFGGITKLICRKFLIPELFRLLG